MTAARELKIFAIVIDMLLLLVGAALIGVGVYVLLDNHKMIEMNRIDDDGVYTDMSKPGLLDISTLLSLVVGSCFILLSAAGFGGVCTESKCFLALYIGGLVLACLLAAAALGTSVAFTQKIDDDLYDAIDQGIKQQFEGHITTANAFSKAWDEVQVEFRCCGLTNYTDFKEKATKWWDKDSLEIPKSCCHLDRGLYFDNNQYNFDDLSCGRIPTTQNANIEKTCYTDIKDYLEEQSYLLIGMSIVTLVAAFLGIFVTSCLLRSIKDSTSFKA